MGLIRDSLKGAIQQGSNSFGGNSSNGGYNNNNGNYSGQNSWANAPQYQRPPPRQYNQNMSPYDQSYDAPAPPRHPRSRAYQSNDGAPSYTPSTTYYPAQQQQDAYAYDPQDPYGSSLAPLAPSSSPYSQRSSSPYSNRNSFSQAPRLPTSMAPGPLQLPFAVPQTAAGSAAPFLRGYSRDLQQAGVNQREFMAFVDALNQSIIPNPEMQIANKAAGLAGWFVPGLAAGLALTGVQVVSQIGGAVQVKGATKQVMRNANQNVFGPCGLEVKLQTSQQFNQSIGYYGAPYDPTSMPGQSQMNPALRLQQYDSFICPLSCALPPVASGSTGRQDPLAQLGAWGTNRAQQKAERKAQEDAMKGKMKKANKLESGLLWLVVTNAVEGVTPGSEGYGASYEQDDDQAQYQDQYSQDRKSNGY